MVPGLACLLAAECCVALSVSGEGGWGGGGGGLQAGLGCLRKWEDDWQVAFGPDGCFVLFDSLCPINNLSAI